MAEERVTVFYDDGFRTRRLDCATLVKEDETFLHLRLPRGDVIRIAKRVVRKIEPWEDEAERRRDYYGRG